MLRNHATIALLIVVLALAVRALVPTGYMTSASPSGLTVELCSGVAGKTITIALPGTRTGQPEQNGHGKVQADSPCAFTALGHAAGPATDPILLAIAIAFVVALGVRLVPLPPRSGRRQIRPPLRGPPLDA